MNSIYLFVPCMVDAMYPEVAEATVELLRRLSVRVHYPDRQTCCGQPAFNSGFRKEATAAARHFIDVFSGARTIVCPSGSCVHMVRHYYPQLLGNDPEWLSRAQEIAHKTFELSEYLIDVLSIEHLEAGYDGRLTYHDSCHLLRGLRVSEQPRKLIRMVRRAEFVEMQNSDICCGFGGAFSTKYPDISTAMLSEKVENIRQSEADAVVGCDIGCLMNIQGFMHRRRIPIKTLHIAQLLVSP